MVSSNLDYSAEFLAKDLGLLVENATEEQLGTARKVTIHQTTTTLIVDAASKDERLGADIIQKALVAPASLIAHNAGVEGEVVVEKIKESDWEVGYNAMTDKYENLMEASVIDPTKVTKCALQNAASVAGMVLITQAIVVEKPKPKPQVAEPPEGALTV
ncbi:ruBisCO large subunit-binding protein subunit alpha, chloroplastic [Zea mays]|uniref:ruBisCO large subunit-binding protein subunit alpha, chloroplastic n=1 Tax=Zea mays TaxID=4577 RepID=UPI0009AAD38D|nr:ruBisCO large subunit-binding protein subunit alpha, chloroplastic [Zea mays]|eukprot:XP_020398622.1 ruBisCO large subunit-binding protein subunit alpha, chloroplastic [Zea mays]